MDPSTFEPFLVLLESDHFYSSYEVKQSWVQNDLSSFEVVNESEETLGLALENRC